MSREPSTIVGLKADLRSRRSAFRPTIKGFTLLEMLVVLTIVGLLAGVALPQLERMATSVELRNQRKSLESAIDGLGYQAYATGKPITLGAAAAVPGRPTPELPLKLPPGWQIKLMQPVFYAINGVCSGGKIVIVDPTGGRAGFLLKPPKCQLLAVANSE